METVVGVSIHGEKFELTFAEAIKLRNALEEMLEWAPGWSSMIFIPPKDLPFSVLN